MPWLLRFVLTLGIFAGGAHSARAADPELARVINVVIDVADLPASRSEVDAVAKAELDRLLAAEEQLPAGVMLADDRRAVIELRSSPIPGTDDLLIHVSVELEGELLAESSTESCLSCTDEQVAEKALLLLVPLLSKFPAPAPVVAPAPAVADADEQLDPEPTTSQPDRALLISGSALLGVGVAGIGVGVGLIAADERVVSPFGALDPEVIKYREVGIATTVVAGAAAVSGAVLLGLALRQRKRSTIAAAPALGPRNWGISVMGRF